MQMLFRTAYSPPFGLFNGHLETIYPALFRKVRGVNYTHTDLDTPDGDFLELAWERSAGKADTLAIISHGLEGNVERTYVKGMVKRFVAGGWHALAWNYRGCGTRMNRLPRFYHSGATDDLHTVIAHALSLQIYQKIVLVGFSLGGNLTLKYLGEQAGKLSTHLKGAVVFSAPVHLSSCSTKLCATSNWVYSEKFKQTLRKKVRTKAKLMPQDINPTWLNKVRTLKDFDTYYTAPLHGFASAEDYYEKCSSLYSLPAIDLPALLVNAENDPLLAPPCFPIEIAEKHPFFHLEITRKGGHCGFSRAQDGFYWSENRAFQWATEI
ncbi:MAG: alpha/beta fold hydrolase [Bacteroidetes bacterium]|nr:MAG: alpha/beta fold hydrolase [Bacteroidota bacterium]